MVTLIHAPARQFTQTIIGATILGQFRIGVYVWNKTWEFADRPLVIFSSQTPAKAMSSFEGQSASVFLFDAQAVKMSQDAQAQDAQAVKMHELTKMIEEFSPVFAEKGPLTDLAVHILDTGDALTTYHPQYTVSPKR